MASSNGDENGRDKGPENGGQLVHLRADNTEPEQPARGRADHLKPYQFQPGESGNPHGRPKGSKNALAEDFLRDLREFWQTDGPDVIRRAAKDKPADLIKSIVHLLPKEVRHSFEEMDDSALGQRIEQLTNQLGFQLIEINPKEKPH